MFRVTMLDSIRNGLLADPKVSVGDTHRQLAWLPRDLGFELHGIAGDRAISDLSEGVGEAATLQHFRAQRSQAAAGFVVTMAHQLAGLF